MSARAASLGTAGGGTLLLGIAAAAALSFATVQSARAACTITPLVSGVAVMPAMSPEVYSFTQFSNYWSAVAVQPRGDDWDLTVNSGTGPAPDCVTGTLATSNLGGSVLDFVVGDFNHNATGTYYVRVNRFAGTSTPIVQYDDGPDALAVNAAMITQDLDPTDVIRVYDVFLLAGTTYTFDFFPQSGTGMHMFVFRNALGGTYWAGRSSAELDLSACGSYTAPTTGFYGVVVTNENQRFARYSLGVTAFGCDCPVSLGTGASLPTSPYRLTWESSEGLWQGVAIRPFPLGSGADWDLSLYGQPTGTTSPPCLSGLLASSGLGGSFVDFTVGDFNHTPYGWNFAYATLFSGTSFATVKPIASHGRLLVNNHVADSFVADDLVHLYDVHLEAGKSYVLSLEPGAAGMEALLFANTVGGPYFAGRSSSVFSTIGAGSYTPTVTGDYGLAVVNDGGVLAGYSVTVGDCSLITPMAAGLAYDTPADVNRAYYSCPQIASFWTAACVTSPTKDWDLAAGGDAAYTPWPACTSLPLATSNESLPRQDLIVGDFNHSPPGTFYLQTYQFGFGPVIPAKVQWDSGFDVLIPNDNNLTVRTVGAGAYVECWDIYLDAGQSYTFSLTHSGLADLHMLLFRNPGVGAYWAGRSAAMFDLPGSTATSVPVSGYYGFVVVNDNGQPGSYTLQVITCDPPTPLPLAPFALAATAPKTFLQFTQTAPYWTPIAVRSDVPLEDWDMYTYSIGSGGPGDVCFDGFLAASLSATLKTDFVVGDFNYNPYGLYFATAKRWSGTSGAHVQYFEGSQTLLAGGAHALRTKPSSFLVESWDAPLLSGVPYTLLFTHDPGLDVKVAVFPSAAGVQWAGRDLAYVESASSVSFTAPTTGTAGIVVVSDGGAGSFDLALRTGTLDVESVRPVRDALNSTSPNPGRGGMRFDYALHDGASVEFEVIDMAGRVVSRLQPGHQGAGTWSQAWPAADARGHRLAAGIYFVRMRAGDRTIGQRRLTLLE